MVFCTNCGERLVVYGDDFVIPNIGQKPNDQEFETVVRKPVAETSHTVSFATALPPSRFSTFAKWIGGTVAAASFGSLIAVALFAMLGIAGAVMLGLFDPPQPQKTPEPVKEYVYITVTPTPAKKEVTTKEFTPPPPPPETPKPKSIEPPPSPYNSALANAMNVARRAECRVVNGRNGTVNLRRYCDEINCDENPETMASSLPVGSTVYKTGGVAGLGRMRWTEVVVGGKTFFVAASKLSCN